MEVGLAVLNQINIESFFTSNRIVIYFNITLYLLCLLYTIIYYHILSYTMI